MMYSDMRPFLIVVYLLFETHAVPCRNVFQRGRHAHGQEAVMIVVLME